jgi:hypothetical protein
VGKKTRTPDNAQLDELRELVAESDGAGNGAPVKRTDRRSLLKMAGAAALGAAGMAAVKVMPAAAATGGNMIIGCNNAATTMTSLDSTGAIVANLFANGSANTYGVWAGGNSGAGEIGVFGQSKSGTGTGVQGTTDSGTGVIGSASGTGSGVLGTASSGHGVSGTASTGIGTSGAASGTGTGVVGTAGAGGIGVNGAGSTGYGGLFTSTTGYDVAAGYAALGASVGSGRLGMIGREDVAANAPNIAPTFFVTSTGHFTFEHEFVRGRDSSIWATRFATSGTNQSRWKRINAVRVDTSDGTGAPFAPFRVFDTRSGAIKAAGSTTVVPVAGHGTGASSIPAGAVAVIGNLTATDYTGSGFLSIAPAGVTVGTSAVNFITGQAAIANGFIVGLSGGNLQVKVAGHSSHFLVDITGYIE